jgi:hypothetical protein
MPVDGNDVRAGGDFAGPRAIEHSLRIDWRPGSITMPIISLQLESAEKANSTFPAIALV